MKGDLIMDIAKDLFFSQQALTALFSATNKLQMQGDKSLQDLTLRQMLALPAILHAPEGKATINHIARVLGTSKQSAKHIVDALERKGYLAVTANAQDKRAVSITITPEGHQAFAICSERTDDFLAQIFQTLDTEELELLCTLLYKLLGEADSAPMYDETHADLILQHHPVFHERRSQNHA